MLLIDRLKSARRTGRRTILDNVLSMVLFVGMLIEFMTVKAVVSSTFFLLLVISFVDVAASFGVSVRAAVARRDVLLDEAGGGGSGAGGGRARPPPPPPPPAAPGGRGAPLPPGISWS